MLIHLSDLFRIAGSLVTRVTTASVKYGGIPREYIAHARMPRRLVRWRD
jgi:hypothetical protein